MKYWIPLILAVIFEALAALSLKTSTNTENHLYTALYAILFIISLGMFYIASKGIPLSIGYAIWAGLGLSIVSIIGIFVFKEEISLMKIVFLLMIIIGVVGLKLVSK
ncbi:DMT family transporter [Helicobacter cappadocius]|uniref:Multidrug efflux SMR transporter n=1 Tax=Helicobacter cappadocius TaxID=3063998 RepID=A0AA90PT42_9HELI|nr:MULTISPECIES: multidrug efflux SMR transporter [unclassified Helicobacter]MDO7253823.1 multidrug efflux SMR transporter [Helicobacter sp. faydin-H75]MDP2539712.1 multidrug efflux SMR transporter [Helicobacter sp. faydin-H76]